MTSALSAHESECMRDCLNANEAACTVPFRLLSSDSHLPMAKDLFLGVCFSNALSGWSAKERNYSGLRKMRRSACAG